MRDPAEFFHEFGLMRKFSALAEQKKLDQQNPYKDAIAFSRLFILWQALMDDIYRGATIEPTEIINYYDSHKDNFKEVHVKAIYITFTDDAGSEDRAKAKAVKLVAGVKGGADFVKLVKENSEDETSKAKDGDFATLRPTDKVPDAIRIAVFALKKGETSDPIRQPHGFYIFRAEDVSYRPLSSGARPDLLRSETGERRGAGGQAGSRSESGIPQPGLPASQATDPHAQRGEIGIGAGRQGGWHSRMASRLCRVTPNSKRAD